jgi:hypothetical protein
MRPCAGKPIPESIAGSESHPDRHQPNAGIGYLAIAAKHPPPVPVPIPSSCRSPERHTEIQPAVDA